MWYKLPILFPSNGQTVWVRRLYSLQPFQATYYSASDSFIDTNGHECPWYVIDRWKAV